MGMRMRRHCLWLANMAQRGDNCCLRRVVATLLLINKTNERIKIMLHPQSSRGSNWWRHKEPTEADQKRRTRKPKMVWRPNELQAANGASVQRAAYEIKMPPHVPELSSAQLNSSHLLSRCGDVTMTVVVRHVWCMLHVPRCTVPHCAVASLWHSLLFVL